MGKRSTARRLAMQAVYQSDISGITADKALENLFDEEKLADDTKKFASRLANGTIDNKAAIDAKIAGLAKNWTVDRISAINMSILRLAFFELMFEKDTPGAVAINEALELAKRYSDAESAKFINGILGNL
jgi:N utilization substance protein B